MYKCFLLVLQHSSGTEASLSRIRLHSAIPSGVHLLHGQLHDHRVIPGECPTHYTTWSQSLPGECRTHYTTWSQSHSRWVPHPLHHMITESFQMSAPPTTPHDHRVIPSECPTRYTTYTQSHIMWVPLSLHLMLTESFHVSVPPTTLHDHIVISGECPSHYTTWS